MTATLRWRYRAIRPAPMSLACIGALALAVALTSPSSSLAPARSDPLLELPTIEGAFPPAASAARPLFAPGLSLRAASVPVPLELHIPSLGVSARVRGVGLTSNGVMDAPTGDPGDPVWQEVFWYRGGGIPGAPGTATIAGHVSGGTGPSVFAALHELGRGQVVVVRDMRDLSEIRFVVSSKRTFSSGSLDREALVEIYGAGPVAGRDPMITRDGSSRLTLITCAGDLVGSGYDQRLVVYAIRAP